MSSPEPELLVEHDWLESRLGDDRVRPVDLRVAEEYAEGRIPGAAHLELAELGVRRGPCENVVLAPAAFEAVMARLGISNRDTVVVYDDQWGLAASRLLWALHYYGHASVAVLNGGWDRWREAGGPVEEGDARRRTARFAARRDPAVHADFAYVAAVAARTDVVFLDTRTETEYDGGHLPGAKLWDWFNAVPEASWACARAPERLRADWEEIGVRSSDEVVVYCRSGMRAAHTYMALRHAGFPRVRLYDGSWQEWSARVASGGPP